MDVLYVSILEQEERVNVSNCMSGLYFVLILHNIVHYCNNLEAADWAGMLYRMYKRFAERRKFKITIVEEMTADFGIKSVEMKFEGPFAYGYLAGTDTVSICSPTPFIAHEMRHIYKCIC